MSSSQEESVFVDTRRNMMRVLAGAKLGKLEYSNQLFPKLFIAQTMHFISQAISTKKVCNKLVSYDSCRSLKFSMLFQRVKILRRLCELRCHILHKKIFSVFCFVHFLNPNGPRSCIICLLFCSPPKACKCVLVCVCE